MYCCMLQVEKTYQVLRTKLLEMYTGLDKIMNRVNTH